MRAQNVIASTLLSRIYHTYFPHIGFIELYFLFFFILGEILIL